MYKFIAVDEKGHRETGAVAIEDYTRALEYVRRNYGMVLQLEEIAKEQSHGQNYSDRQRSYFFKQLAAILQSGVTISDGLNILAMGKDNNMLHIIKGLSVGIANGLSVHDAMVQMPDFFTELCLTLVRAGEESGELPTMCLQLADYFDRKTKFQDYLAKVLAYPLLVLGVGICVFFLFLLVVLPNIGSMYTSLRAPISGSLEVLLGLQRFLVKWWYFVVTGLIFLVYAVYRSRRHLVMALLALPYIRNLYAVALELRFCKLFVLLLNSGVDILSAINSAALVVTQGPKYLQMQKLKTALAKGEDLANVLEREEGIFSPVMRGFMIVGSRTGTLTALMQDGIRIQEESFNQRMEKIKEYLPPVLLIIVAFLIAFIVLSVMHPIFNLFDALPVYS